MGRIFPKRKGALFGKFGNVEFVDFLETVEILLDFLEFRQVWKGERILEILELILGGLIVTHPTTDHAPRLA